MACITHLYEAAAAAAGAAVVAAGSPACVYIGYWY